MQKRKQKKHHRKQKKDRVGRLKSFVPRRAAMARIVHCLRRVQKLYLETHDPTDREGLPELEVARRTHLTRSRAANLIHAMPEIDGVPARSCIVGKRVKSPVVVKLVVTMLRLCPGASTRAIGDALHTLGREVSPRAIREIVWEQQHPHAPRRNKKGKK